MAFFEELGKRITDAGQTIAQKTTDFTEVTKLNSNISDLEKQISKLFTALGQTYYEAHKDDSSAEYADSLSEITALYGQIAEKKEQIKQIKGVTKCECCGADVPADAAFCNACGAKINRDAEAAPAEAAEPECLCPICHNPIKPGNLFCTHCGAKLEIPNESNE